MNSILNFRAFPKLARLSRQITISEKLDGTNAQVVIAASTPDLEQDFTSGLMRVGEYFIRAGSRNRWISLGDDNYGFARWVFDNREELVKLGPGQHFGEWWGLGIQRKYGIAEKRFSLFNTAKWSDPAVRPTCCSVVPVLGHFDFDTRMINNTLEDLKRDGSIAAPGFMNPEGIVIYHHASGQLFKKTCEHDDAPKTLPGLTNPALLDAVETEVARRVL